ncbi:hypothetical protein KVE47_01090 [Helicobacter pylori]|nr:hypothetical protein KVE47_01090 [Helicobacter pylori]
MRQKHETTASFNKLKEITQAMLQTQKLSAQTNANANASEITRKSVLTPKARAQAKKGALKPTKRAFSERQITTIRDKSQASANERLESEQGDKQGDNTNAFKSDEKNTRGQQ